MLVCVNGRQSPTPSPSWAPKVSNRLLLLLLLSRFSRVRLCTTPQMAAHQAPPSVGFSKQEYWSGVPLPSPSNRLQNEDPELGPNKGTVHPTVGARSLCANSSGPAAK